MTTLKRRCSGLFHSAALGLAVLIGALWASGAVQAQADPAAGVHFASGYVAATAPGVAERQLAKGDDVYRGDRVDTADNGRVQMRFTDGGLVSLMPNSTFTVEEYFHDGGPEEDASLVFGLLKGGLRTVTGTIGSVQHDQYELKTPVATLGIRGTEYVAVLRPANTLRVHVGRGKVVITNDQGSLEVPEGRNAIVTLGSAPEFSEQGPQYQATGPMGDRLTASYQHRQDPHLLDPRANMPEYEVTLIAGEGYQMVVLPFGDGPLGFSPGNLDSGNWTLSDSGSSGVLTWGIYSDGAGTINGDPLSLGSGQTLPFVAGTATPAVTPPSGAVLSYTLDGATSAYTSSGIDVGTLNKFDLGINVSALSYTLGFELETLNEGVFTVTAPNNTGSLSSLSPEFGFSHTVDNLSVCPPAGCNLTVGGFLAGANAEQAGVVYQIDGASSLGTVTGAAGLKTTSSSPGLGF